MHIKPCHQNGFTLMEVCYALMFSVVIIYSLISLLDWMLFTNKEDLRLTKQEQIQALMQSYRTDFSSAVSDSIRSYTHTDGRLFVEFVPSTGQGMFEVNGSDVTLSACPSDVVGLTGTQNDRLSFGVTDSCFKTLGSPFLSSVTSNQYIILPGTGNNAIYGLGSASGNGKAKINAITLSSTSARISFDASVLNRGPVQYGQYFLVGSATPVTWECNPNNGTIIRHTNYGWFSSMAVSNYTSSTQDVSNMGITGCSFITATTAANGFTGVGGRIGWTATNVEQEWSWTASPRTGLN